MSAAPTPLSWMDYVTLATATVGAVLGIMNTWNALNQNRVKLKVRPVTTISIPQGKMGFGIEVINLSAFPVTINDVGFSIKGGHRVESTLNNAKPKNFDNFISLPTSSLERPFCGRSFVARKPAKNMSTEYVPLFPTVPKMPVPSVDVGLRALFWFRASLALFSVLSTLCPQREGYR